MRGLHEAIGDVAGEQCEDEARASSRKGGEISCSLTGGEASRVGTRAMQGLCPKGLDREGFTGGKGQGGACSLSVDVAVTCAANSSG